RCQTRKTLRNGGADEVENDCRTMRCIQRIGGIFQKDHGTRTERKEMQRRKISCLLERMILMSAYSPQMLSAGSSHTLSYHGHRYIFLQVHKYHTLSASPHRKAPRRHG